MLRACLALAAFALGLVAAPGAVAAPLDPGRERCGGGPCLVIAIKAGSGAGRVVSEPAGIDCGASCETTATHGSWMTLVATPDPGSTFAGWTGECTTVEGNRCHLWVDFEKRATATFQPAAGPPPPPPPAPPPPPPPPPAVDRTPPDTRLTRGPAGRTRARAAAFGFAASEAAARFQCKLDRGAWTSCRSPKRYRVLRTGVHTFRVRALDAAGNADATPARRTWRIRP